MLGVEFVRDDDGSPDADVASRIVGESLDRGLILLKAGMNGNVIRTLVPLVITDESWTRRSRCSARPSPLPPPPSPPVRLAPGR